MKKILLSSLIAAAAAVPAFAGVDNINYQAVIKNGSAVLADQEVALKFELLDKSAEVVYSEEQTPKTNAAGYVSCQLGKDDALSTIEWGDLTLRVSINLGNGYQVISNEAVSSVPTALYALRSADTDEIKDAVEGLLLDNEATQERLNGISAEIVQFQGFIDDQDAFNTEIVEKVQPMIGLNYEEINDFHERITTEVLTLQEFKEDADNNLQAINDELAKLHGLNAEEVNDYLQRVSEALTNLNDFQDDADKALQALNDAIRDVHGLNVDEINDFHERVSDELLRLGQSVEELNTNTDAFATMVETRFDKIQAQVDLLDPEVEGLVKDMEDVKNNVKDMGADVAQIEGLAGKVEMLEESMAAIASPSDPDSMMNQINAAMGELGEAVEGLVKDNEETKANVLALSADVAQVEGLANDIDALNEQIDSFATMVETRIDKVQNQADATDKDLENIKENLTNAFDAKDAEIAEINGQLENLNNVAAVVRANEEAIEELNTNTEAMATMMGNNIDKVQKQVDGLDSDLENVKENLTNSFTAIDTQIAEINGQLENLNNVSAVVRENEKAIEELNTNTEAMATMTEGRIDKLQNQVDVLENEVADLKDQFNQLIQALKDLDIIPTTFK